MSPDLSTVHRLRTDLALQIARYVALAGHTQVALAARLGVPQPTLSKIANGQVDGLSLELLLRIAVRASLPVVLQTGTHPSEAGVYRAGAARDGRDRVRARAQSSGLDDHARDAVARGVSQLDPEQRLEAQLQHVELQLELQRSAARPTERRSRRARASRS